jgi:hypothetical protein
VLEKVKSAFAYTNAFGVTTESAHRLLSRSIPVGSVMWMNTNGKPKLVCDKPARLEVLNLGLEPIPFRWEAWLARPTKGEVRYASIEAWRPEFDELLQVYEGLVIHHLWFPASSPSSR